MTGSDDATSARIRRLFGSHRQPSEPPMLVRRQSAVRARTAFETRARRLFGDGRPATRGRTTRRVDVGQMLLDFERPSA